jgi:tryptophanyl-tRNA synthetase
MKKNVVVTGFQPTGNLHVGNYLGAIKNIVEMQNSSRYQMHVFVADLHALTGKISADDLREQTKITAAELLATGVDPDKTVFFVQSHVPEHTELAWLFNCVTPMAELERMTQYKDKSTQFRQSNAGLFTYPVLQAADILMYKGELVPVGHDQIQHIELTRDIARWFNNKYGAFFPETKHLLTKSARVMSLLEPEKKMSKSLGAGHVIELREEPEEIDKKIKRAVTATSGGGAAPGAQNLLGLLKEFGNKNDYEKFARAEKDGNIKYGDLKSALSEVISAHFSDFRKRRTEFLADEKKLDKILREGAEKAREEAGKTMSEARQMVGLK